MKSLCLFFIVITLLHFSSTAARDTSPADLHLHHHHCNHGHDHVGDVAVDVKRKLLPEELAEEEDLKLYGFGDGNGYAAHHDHDHHHQHHDHTDSERSGLGHNEAGERGRAGGYKEVDKEEIEETRRRRREAEEDDGEMYDEFGNLKKKFRAKAQRAGAAQTLPGVGRAGWEVEEIGMSERERKQRDIDRGREHEDRHRGGDRERSSNYERDRDYGRSSRYSY